jgi:thiamine-monophosphate kinase
LTETKTIDLIRRLASRKFSSPQILKSIGDDCAVVRPTSRQDLVFTTDFVLEDRHFQLATHSAADVGHKSLTRSLSDLAAMGAKPLFCLVSLGLPPELASRWLRGFYSGFLSLADRYQVTLAGGDLARFDKVVVDVMCCGSLSRGVPMLRSAARPGDLVYVTGELGGSAHGFATKRGATWRRHLRPSPRIEAGLALRKLGVRTCMDLSDGLSLDLARLCRESKVSAELDAKLPLAAGASIEEALNGGEDYELLFTAPARKKIPKAVAGLPITCVGEITHGNAGRVRLAGRLLKPKGFDHFA